MGSGTITMKNTPTSAQTTGVVTDNRGRGRAVTQTQVPRSVQSEIAYLILGFWLGVVCATLSSVAIAGSWQQPLDTNTYEQLTDIATSLVDSPEAHTSLESHAAPLTGTTAAQSTTQTRGIAGNDVARLPPQVLLIERLESKREQSDTAEVYVYSYRTEQTTRHLIDINTGEHYRTDIVPRISLPLNAFETAHVLSMIKQDPIIIERLSHDHQQQLGAAFSGWDTIESKVSIWLPPINHSKQAQSCLRQRCALVTLFTGGYYNFSVTPIVNLNTGEIFLDTIR